MFKKSPLATYLDIGLQKRYNFPLRNVMVHLGY